MPRPKAALFPLFLATAFVPASLLAQVTYGAAPSATLAPGAINFTAGQVNVDGQPLANQANQARQLHPGQTLATANGSADLLLAPGALVRVGDDATLRMVAADARRTEVSLSQGVANISVNLIRPGHLLLLDLPNGQTQVLERGLYTFNAATGEVRVFSGEADIFRGADTSTIVKPVKLKQNHEIALAAGGRLKAASFNPERDDTDLLPWTGLQETQAAIADSGVRYSNAGYGDAYASNPGYGFYGDGALYAGYGYGYPWGSYGFYGYPFFGVGFGGFYGGGYGYGGYGYGGFPHGPGRGPIGPIRDGGGYGDRALAGGGYRGGSGFGGFHGGGGFSGGGGGSFHGGGGGGGHR